MSVDDPSFQGEVFFTSSLDCKWICFWSMLFTYFTVFHRLINVIIGKVKAWRVDGGTLTLLHALDSPKGSPVNCLTCANSELVFGGCQDGGIIAWNIMQNSSDVMEPAGMNVSLYSKGFIFMIIWGVLLIVIYRTL